MCGFGAVGDGDGVGGVVVVRAMGGVGGEDWDWE